MPTYSDALTTIESQINTDWTYTKVAYGNVEPLDYSDPGRPLLSDGTDPYIEVNVNFAESFAAEVGLGKYLALGDRSPGMQ